VPVGDHYEFGGLLKDRFVLINCPVDISAIVNGVRRSIDQVRDMPSYDEREHETQIAARWQKILLDESAEAMRIPSADVRANPDPSTRPKRLLAWAKKFRAECDYYASDPRVQRLVDIKVYTKVDISPPTQSRRVSAIPKPLHVSECAQFSSQNMRSWKNANRRAIAALVQQFERTGRNDLAQLVSAVTSSMDTAVAPRTPTTTKSNADAI
jgi:hypothetical protein